MAINDFAQFQTFRTLYSNTTAAPTPNVYDYSIGDFSQHNHVQTGAMDFSYNSDSNAVKNLLLKMAKIMLPCIRDEETKNTLIGLILQIDPMFSLKAGEVKEDSVLGNDLFEL